MPFVIACTSVAAIVLSTLSIVFLFDSIKLYGVVQKLGEMFQGVIELINSNNFYNKTTWEINKKTAGL